MAVHILKIPDWQRYSDIITENDEYEMVISLKQDGNNAVSPIVERVYRDLYTAAVEDLDSDKPLYLIDINPCAFPMLLCRYNGDMISYNADFQASVDAVDEVLMDIDMETKIDATNFLATIKNFRNNDPATQCVINIVRSRLGAQNGLQYSVPFICEVLKSHVSCIEPFGFEENDEEEKLVEEMSTLDLRTLLCCIGYCKEFQVLQARKRTHSVTGEYETFVYLVEHYGYSKVCRQLYRELAERRYFKKGY